MTQRQKRSTYFHTQGDVNEKNMEDVCKVYDELLSKNEMTTQAIIDGLSNIGTDLDGLSPTGTSSTILTMRLLKVRTDISTMLKRIRSI